ncbi:hypothetical protein [Kitasatospora sp. NPDC001527]|uniref:hypothetical protein n=1 Tax=Kitasatospora sp. NPDC001527 TaxID=3154519 RepID=UPI003319EA1F
MDLVYTSLRCRNAASARPTGEVAEVLGVLWAHSTPEDGLEHISGSLVSDRVDLLMYFLTPVPPALAAPSAVERAAALLSRSHRASPALHRRYLPPEAPTR